MVLVNLLPWRRMRLQRQFHRWCILLCILLTGLLTGVFSGHWQRALNQQQAATLKIWDSALNDIAELHARTHAAQQRFSLLQLQFQQRLQRQRSLAFWQDFAHVLEQITPRAVWLLSLEKRPPGVELQGLSRDTAALYQLRDRLGQMARFQHVALGGVERDKQGDMRFTLRAWLQEQPDE